MAVTAHCARRSSLLAVSLTRPFRAFCLLSAEAASSVPTLQVGLSTPLTAFVPRPAVTEQLCHALGACSDEKHCSLPAPSTAPHHLRCHVAVLHGMGGVGKTQLALHHALQQGAGVSRYTTIWWVAAEQRDSLPLQYRALASQAGIEVDASCDFASLVSAINSWLSSRHEWLLVLDNVGSYDDVQGIMPPTEHPSQHVIITTRHTEWPAAFCEVPVDVMEAAEALALLKAAAGIQSSDWSQVWDIALTVSELGRLPLALSHAGAYIRQRRTTVRQYLDRYRPLLLDGKAKMPTGDPYQQVVATTWGISIAAVDAACRDEGLPLLGRALLTACAYLDVDGVPASLLRRWLLQSGLAASEDEADAALAVLAVLSQYSLLHLPAVERPRVKMHRVLALVLRHQHEHQYQQPAETAAAATSLSGQSVLHRPLDLSWCETMVKAVAREYKLSAELDALRDVRLLSQMQSLRQALDRHGSDCGWLGSLARAELLSQVGYVLLFRLREDAKAKVELEAALAILEAHHGCEHVRVAEVLNSLGAACIQLGEYRRARELLERALRIKEANYGANDVRLAPALANLGNAHRELGEHAKAKEMHERALAMREAHHGPNHVEVALSLIGLASVYGSLGDYSRKKELLERALAIGQAHYGPQHIELAVTLNNLGGAYSALGDQVKARDTLQRALAIQQAAYGDHHIELAATLHNLGSAHGMLGEQHKKRELLEGALAIEERHYGSEHVQVAITLKGLGRAYGALGDHARAKETLQRALRIMEAHYGPQQHENLAIVRNNLSKEHAALGDAENAATRANTDHLRPFRTQCSSESGHVSGVS